MFTTLKLTGERVLVKGTDSAGTEGNTVLDASEWNEVTAHRSHADASENFDAEVEKFFAPIMKAAEKFAEAGTKEIDPISYVTIHEGTDSVQGRDAVTIKLSHDSIVLRLLEQGDHDRLVWVNDTLEVLEVLAGTTPEQAQSQGTEPHEDIYN